MLCCTVVTVAYWKISCEYKYVPERLREDNKYSMWSLEVNNKQENVCVVFCILLNVIQMCLISGHYFRTVACNYTGS